MKEFLQAMVVKTDWMKTFVGAAFVGLFVFSVCYVLMLAVPEGNREIAHFMIGEVSGVALTIAAYYFGSSKGSQEKQRTLDKISDDKPKN